MCPGAIEASLLFLGYAFQQMLQRRKTVLVLSLIGRGGAYHHGGSAR
jgi:hypothetical protein